MTKEKEDCPNELIRLAVTPWEKACVIEFVEIETKLKETYAQLRNEIKWCKWLTVSLFAAIIVTRLI